MKKSLIALAALAATGLASAQSAVTLSGTLEVAPLRSQTITETPFGSNTAVKVKTRQTGQNNTWSTSVVNITATEDLGGGLTATAVMISGVGDGFAARERTLQLASNNMGALRFGRFAPGPVGNLNAIQGTGSATMVGTLYGIVGGGAGNAVLNANAGILNMERQDNVLQYTSPTFNGLNVSIYNITNSADSDAANAVGKVANKQNGIHLGYAAGPLSLGFAINKQKVTAEAANQAAADAVKQDHDLNWAAVSYDFGVARLALSHARRDVDVGVTAPTQAIDIKLTQLAVTVPMGALTLRGSAYRGKDARTVAANDNLKLSGYQLSASYALSKRTTLVAAAGKAQNKRDGGDNVQGTRKTSQNTLTMNHTF